MCVGYFRAMVDMNEMLATAFRRPMWCADGVRRIDQLKLVVLKFMKERPELIHGPFAAIVYTSLGNAFPCAQWKKPAQKK
jgi:hypothetical protein